MDRIFWEVESSFALQYNLSAYFADEAHWHDLNWLEGKPFRPSGKIVVHVDAVGSFKKCFDEIDFFYVYGGAVIVSDRAWSVLQRLTTLVQSFAATMVWKKLKRSVRAVNLMGVFPAMDMRRSEYSTISGYADIVTDVQKLVLDAKKISAIPRSEMIFRMGESRSWIICTDTAKNLLESRGIKGVHFLKVGEPRGYV